MRQDLSTGYRLTLANVYFADHAFELWLHLCTTHRRDHRVAIDPHRQREDRQKDDRGDGKSDDHAAAALLHGHETALAVQHGLQDGDEGNLFVHLRVAKRYSGLTCEDL